MNVQIVDNSTMLRAFAADGTYLGGARREYAIGSRGQRPWWDIRVGNIVTDANSKADARVELRRLAAGLLGEMPAITVRLPWADALRAGVKLVENRSKRIPPQYIGCQIAIHASAAFDPNGAADERIRNWWWGRPEDDRGPVDATNFSYLFRKVVSVGTLVDCHQATSSHGVTCCQPWGQLYPAWHCVFTDMVALNDPVPASGSLLLPWSLPADVTTLVRRQLSRRSHLDACGCLRNEAGAHRVGCPDFPQGVRSARFEGR